MPYTGHHYVFTAKVIPSWVKFGPLEIEAEIAAFEGGSACHLHIRIDETGGRGELRSEEAFSEGGTLWHFLESRTEALVDVLAFTNAVKVDCYVDYIHDKTCGADLVLNSVSHELVSVLSSIGISFDHVARLMQNRRYEYHLRHALFLARRALYSPGETAFYGYRAIETLVNYYVDIESLGRNSNGRPKGKPWENFRDHYGISRSKMDRLSKLSQPLRHGNYRDAIPLNSSERLSILESIWEAIALFVKKEVSKG